LGIVRGKRAGKRSRTVCEDWLAWIPNEMDQLFEANRNELESTNVILSITLDEALSLCKRGQFEAARERVHVFGGLFDRLGNRLCHVIYTIQQHGSHFGTLPNVTSLVPSNFRGETAQRVSFMSSLLARVLFRQRMRFFHKLYSLDEIIGELQREAGAIVRGIEAGASVSPNRAWQQLEVLGYDLNTCMGETTVVLKSFFCALPAEELDTFRQRLAGPVPTPPQVESGRPQTFHGK